MKRTLHRRLVTTALLASVVVVAGAAGWWFYAQSTPWATVSRLWGRFSYRASAPYAGDVLMPVPFYPQQHALSCEAAALRMALAYRGIAVSEQEVIDRIGSDPTPRTAHDGAVIWGDPDKGFVGNINGRMFSSGYGVHWIPVARAANQWRLAEVVQGWDAPTLAAQVRLGNPVIAWIYIGSGAPYTWTTPAGRTVRTVSREHAVVVNGFRGVPDAPEGFYVMDPIYGQRYMTVADFMKHWSAFEQSGVIIN